MPNFPVLTFLPMENLLIHERHDDERTQPLILRIRASGVLRNPPIVAPLSDGTDRCMVLDGANRITALRELGYPHALVQVVTVDDPGLNLQNWNHVIWEYNPVRFLLGIRQIAGLHLALRSMTDVQLALDGDCGLVIVQTCKGRAYVAGAEVNGLETRVELLNAIVNSYSNRSRLDRTSAYDINVLRDIYPSLCGLVIFPNLKIGDLLRLAGQGYLLPSGITRFTISPRALHLNYPLDELVAHKPIEVKNQTLQKWIQDRLAHKRVRYYAESTYLFDE